MGSWSPGNKKSEKFENGNWSDLQEAPVHLSFRSYAAIFYGGNFYYFGGYDLTSILRLSAASWTWSIVGQLNASRNGHGVILVDNKFMVIGGSDIRPTEACLLRNGRFNCEEKRSSLLKDFNTPILFLVDDNYQDC